MCLLLLSWRDIPSMCLFAGAFFNLDPSTDHSHEVAFLSFSPFLLLLCSGDLVSLLALASTSDSATFRYYSTWSLFIRGSLSPFSFIRLHATPPSYLPDLFSQTETP